MSIFEYSTRGVRKRPPVSAKSRLEETFELYFKMGNESFPIYTSLVMTKVSTCGKKDVECTDMYPAVRRTDIVYHAKGD